MLSRDAGSTPVQMLRWGRTQKVATSASAATLSSGLASGMIGWRLVADQDVHLTYGASPSAATAASALIKAGQVEYIQAYPGDVISVIRDSADGNLYVTEVG